MVKEILINEKKYEASDGKVFDTLALATEYETSMKNYAIDKEARDKKRIERFEKSGKQKLEKFKYPLFMVHNDDWDNSYWDSYYYMFKDEAQLKDYIYKHVIEVNLRNGLYSCSEYEPILRKIVEDGNVLAGIGAYFTVEDFDEIDFPTLREHKVE